MNRLMIGGMLGFAALCAAGGDLIVDTPTTLTSTASFDNARISANLTVDGSGVDICATGKVSKLDARVTVTNGARFATTPLNAKVCSSMTIGANGGEGGFDVWREGFSLNSNADLSLWIESLELSANATTDADTFDVLRLSGKAVADITTFTNRNAKAARYVFDGGALRQSYEHSLGNLLYVPSGKKVIFEGVNGNPIVYIPKYFKHTFFCCGGGTFRSQGNCDFIVRDIGDVDSVPAPDCKWRDDNPNTGAGNNPNRGWIRLTAHASYEWCHSGNFRVQDYGWIRLAADDKLPSGANTGYIVLDSTNHYGSTANYATSPRLDMNGYSSAINGLVSYGKGEVTNFASQVKSTLTFGRYRDGVIQAKVCGNIDIAKEGAETTLTISDTELPRNLSILAGTVRVVAGATGKSHLGRVTIAEGATLVLDGVAATCTGFRNNGGTFSRVNGATVGYLSSGATTDSWLDADEVLAVDSVHVPSGRLVFSGDCATNSWWRFTFRACSQNGFSLEIGHIAMFTNKTGFTVSPEARAESYVDTPKLKLTDGIVACDEPTFIKEGTGVLGATVVHSIYTYPVEGATPVADMPEGTCQLQPGVQFWKWTSGRVTKEVGVLFSASSSNADAFDIHNDINEKTPSSWVTLTFRHKANTANDIWNRVRTYSFFATRHGGTAIPRSWLLESSPDGVNWEVMDDRVYDSTFDQYYANGVAYNWFARPDGYALTSGSLNGAKGFASAAVVQVDGEATLDCSYVDGGQLVSSILYDANMGAGTIQGATIAESGTLRVVNSEQCTGRIVIPYTFKDCTNLGNFSNWIVYFNGKQLGGERALQVTDEGLVIPAPGIMIIVK